MERFELITNANFVSINTNTKQIAYTKRATKKVMRHKHSLIRRKKKKHGIE